MEKRYKALRLIAALMKITGIIIGVLSIIGALGVCATVTSGGVAFDRMLREFDQSSRGMGSLAGAMGGVLAGIVPVIVGGSWALFMYAGGEAVNLQIAIEENTRTMVWVTQYPKQPLPSPLQPLEYASGAQPPGVFSPPGPAVQDGPPANVVSTGTERRFCPECGTKIEPTDEACPNCGQALVS
jgi:hypothetical protein